MEPVNFEEHIREKLQDRELKPSEATWDQLSSQLDQEMLSNNPGWRWMAIAASLIGILLMITMVFNTSEMENADNIVEENTIPQESSDAPSPKLEASEVVLATQISEENNTKQNSEVATTKEDVVIEEKIKPQQKVAPLVEDLSRLEEGDIAKEDYDTNKLKETLDESALFMNNKVNEVVASVQAIQQKNDSVTVAEVEALLATANREIANRRILESSTSKIDPVMLLSDVEKELERSFRDKVFKILGEGFEQVRTAVAERNN